MCLEKELLTFEHSECFTSFFFAIRFSCENPLTSSFKKFTQIQTSKMPIVVIYITIFEISILLIANFRKAMKKQPIPPQLQVVLCVPLNSKLLAACSLQCFQLTHCNIYLQYFSQLTFNTSQIDYSVCGNNSSP